MQWSGLCSTRVYSLAKGASRLAPSCRNLFGQPQHTEHLGIQLGARMPHTPADHHERIVHHNRTSLVCNFILQCPTLFSRYTT
jgi:hypothetical protein